MVKMTKYVNRLAYILLVLLLLSISPFVIPKIVGYTPYGILTNSMEPEYPVGSLIYVSSYNLQDIKTGDVITFRLDVKSGNIATHRVVANVQDKHQFITKGDRNEEIDSTPVSYDRVVGKVVFSVPYLGIFYAWLVSTTGIAIASFMLALVVVLWIIVYVRKRKN